MADITANVVLALPADGVSPTGTLTNTTGEIRMTVALPANGEPGTWQLIKQNTDSTQWGPVPDAFLSLGGSGAVVQELVWKDSEANALYFVMQIRPGGSAAVLNPDATVYLSAQTAIAQAAGALSTTTLHATGAATLDSTVSVGGLLTIGAGLVASGAVANDFSGGTGTFKTSTGAGTLSGTTTVAANKDLLCAAGTSKLDFSLGTGIFATPSGAGTLSGTTNIAANKNLTCSAGTTAIDLSLGTGTFKPPTGIFTFQGKQAATATANTIADPGTGAAIPVTTDGVVPIVTAAAETNTLAIPSYMGQELILTMDTRVGGDRVVTASQAINQAGNTIMTFGAARDTICLRGITVGGALRWQVAWNEGVALS